MFGSTSLRLAGLYTTLFALAVAVVGVVTFLSTRQALSEQFDARIHAESSALVEEFRAEQLEGVIEAVRERDKTPGSLAFGVQKPNGDPVIGQLSVLHTQMGWANRKLPGGDETLRLFTAPLPNGYRLLVGDDEARIEALDGAVLRGFGVAFAVVLILGVMGGYALSGDVHRRMGAISGAAEAIIDGDLTRRVPVRGSNDDLDRLAQTFNRMLDRIAGLMEGLNQVSNDIAHDMRTPLTRLRHKLETALQAPDGQAQALEGALGDLDSILETFAALLRIAQIEGGQRRAGFRPCDLTGLAQTVTEAFAPSAEDEGRTLTLAADGPVVVDGDAELLTQMLVNLVENALRHTGRGAAIVVRAAREGHGAVLSVTDDGPGVPPIERERVFDRFYRLERSRSTPGSGLGLALVAAVAKLHGAEVALRPAQPGLEARVTFTEAA